MSRMTVGNILNDCTEISSNARLHEQILSLKASCYKCARVCVSLKIILISIRLCNTHDSCFNVFHI